MKITIPSGFFATTSSAASSEPSLHASSSSGGGGGAGGGAGASPPQARRAPLRDLSILLSKPPRLSKEMSNPWRCRKSCDGCRALSIGPRRARVAARAVGAVAAALHEEAAQFRLAQVRLPF